MAEKLILGITMGDPAGIGPEITVKALAKKEIYDECRPLVIGDAAVMEEAAKIAGREDIKIRAVQSVGEAKYEYGTIDVYDMKLMDLNTLERGKVSAAAGEAAFGYVKKVIELAMAGEIDGTVTNAFNKEAVNLAAHAQPQLHRQDGGSPRPVPPDHLVRGKGHGVHRGKQG